MIGILRSALIIDDDESTRMLLANIVTQDFPGTQVALAGTCEAALALANDRAYDIILLDLLMPGIGGFEILRQIRADSQNQTTPVVVVSVLGAEPGSIERCKSLGADRIVPKPVSRNALITAIKTQLVASTER